MREMADDSGEDPFRLLPDDLLRRVLSFLPPDDALQTCVLDTRWRDFWRRTTSLLLVSDQWWESRLLLSYERVQQLVKLFIKLRGNSPLVKCEIRGYLGEAKSDNWPYTKLLIKYALACQAEELLFRTLHVYDVPLISQHLKTIRLCSVKLEHSSLNLSRCPALEDLKMQFCKIHARRISSKSLKRLCITDLCSFAEDFHTRIFAPGLTELVLYGFGGLPPFLEYMPFLVTARLGLESASTDFCRENHDCGCHAYPVEEGLLLNALSNAVNLELMAEPEMVICRWDLECCPIFDNLKTLLLNECFRAIDLVCILQCSPVLEMLTLQLDNTKILAGAIGAEEITAQPFVCTHLKVVNIKCSKVDEEIRKVLKILGTCGIPWYRININDPCSCSDCFSSQKRPQNNADGA